MAYHHRRNGLLSLTTYGNGDKISYEYNSLGLVKSLTRTDTDTDDGKDEATKFSWSYSGNGTPRAHRDNVNNLRYTYDYDSLGRLVRSTVNTTGGDYVGMVEQGFDVRNNVNRLTTEFGGLTHTQQYFYETNTLNANSASYSKDNLPSAYKFSSNRYATYDYDSLNRLNKRTFTLNGRNLYNNYVYWLSDRNAEGSQLYRTTQLKTELVDNTAYTYTYDKVGNITEVKKGTRTNANTDNIASGSYSAYRSYVYDNLGQLTRENNATAGETHVFTYDSRGNIGSNTTYAYTTASSVANPVSQIDYVYGTDSDAGWKKLITSVDHYEWNDKGEKKLKESEAMDYDEIGNPIVYRDADLLWNGRQLRKYKADNFAETYFYNADGLRVRTKHYIKSGSSYEQTGETRYEYVGSSLAYQVTTNVNGAVEQELYFFYDASGNLSVIRQVTPTKDYHFYVTTNAQGDVLGIYSSTGTLLASYEYDAWGNCTISYDNPTYNIGATNPIRYRGYYYDSETGLYYLQSRYYDPEIGRFINCDDQISGVGGATLGYNVYTYCMNNPVNAIDPYGNWPKWLESAIDWVDNNIVQPVKNFFDPNTNTVGASFEDGVVKGSGSVTVGYSELMTRGQSDKKVIPSNKDPSTTVGVFGKLSGVNASGKIGVGNDDVTLSVKGVGDVLTGSTQAGLNYGDGLGLVVKAKAAVLSGRATLALDIFGCEVEFGVTGDLLSVGAEANIGIYMDGFETKFSAGLGIGGGFIFRIKPSQ